ncbi:MULTISPECIES: 4-carboxymuconolactone decarboxylase [Acinetobacter]|uniref:4-carboxymuconolactone decarboxylase n=2 Tax=Acinetobacter haemolyticus TaxID=29430 RepID=A0AAJ2YSU8_ACIHA|nr:MULTISPECIES: 4-carboxymuconolactone decarboxylase [Acinetobacter]EEH68452.1 4-carboxymuconolactone decarboxylase [Acinetobacter sp. ATCC 27244]ENW17243.1 4-carboxymuconolactone decarboxylase [Acinetobacter haemolyticus CIP 64.3 = MTCC 9819]EPR87963.1 4-carboxymuconolactone decarboxylase [Acinetobacter haemolyticus CIP 64.3 = MTCC 9819]MBO3658106.1 4-carboxymuconolactone decarboxylase [Acinetobacter haemolyticus]MCU4387096.1 4-carboxymuconolactone decarboxylase [Acinetobacter haemolyticus]
MNDEQRYQQGLKVRTEVLGEKHVGRSLENLNDFNQDFQNFISRFAWGEVWSRDGLPRHTRSLVTIAILLALGREDELRMHLRACFNNGVTKDELKELILHSSLYAGLPAANAAMHLAEDVFKEIGIEVQPVSAQPQD